MENPFSLEEITLLEESTQTNYDVTSRKINDQDRMPGISPTVRQELNSTKIMLNERLDKLALIRAKLIQMRLSFSTPAEPANDQNGQSSE